MKDAPGINGVKRAVLWAEIKHAALLDCRRFSEPSSGWRLAATDCASKSRPFTGVAPRRLAAISRDPDTTVFMSLDSGSPASGMTN
jgi:hypothetical protein